MRRLGLLAAVLLILAACGGADSSDDSRTGALGDDTTAEFCSLVQDQFEAAFGDAEVVDLTASQFEASNREVERILARAAEIAPAGLRADVEVLHGLAAATNDIYESVGFDVTRMGEVDPAVLAEVIDAYPQQESDAAGLALDGWTDANC